MTRYAMVVDLRRCVGCQTCTAACKHKNATPPGVQWRWVLDVESGDYPDVRRTFLPVGCQHCDTPTCQEVCPTGATFTRDDGIVDIDYDICIGCAYCIMACPYMARYKTTEPTYAYSGEGAMSNEVERFDPARIGVANKCNFCADRIDSGCAKGLTPGVDPDATPACANACIADALTFGDIDDPESKVSRLIRENEHFRMHESLGNGPNLYYLWDKKAETEQPGAPDKSPTGGDKP